MKKLNRNNMTAAMVVEAGVNIVIYSIETLAKFDVPAEIETYASILVLGIALYFIPPSKEPA